MSREALATLVVGIALVGGSYLYLHKGPCEAPISYTIGTVDPRFGVSHKEFQNDINQAIALWEKHSDTPLFAYGPEGTLTINLVYDIRQATTEKEKVLTAAIDQTTQTAASVREQYLALKDAYERTQEAYSAQVAAFNTAQNAYNKEVERWNSVGGAPQPQYEALTREQERLITLRSALEQKRLEVNELADTVNAFINKYNLLVARINADVNTINNDGLAGTQFEEGMYISDEDGERIDIYQFVDKVDLVRVLAHELGHALALPHNGNPDSIMNPVNQSDTLALSLEDLAALKAECGIE